MKPSYAIKKARAMVKASNTAVSYNKLGRARGVRKTTRMVVMESLLDTIDQFHTTFNCDVLDACPVCKAKES